MWRAFRRIQPDRLERIAEILKRGFTAVANMFGGRYTPDDFEPVKSKRSDQANQFAGHGAEVSPNAAACIASALLGKPDGQRNR